MSTAARRGRPRGEIEPVTGEVEFNNLLRLQIAIESEHGKYRDYPEGHTEDRHWTSADQRVTAVFDGMGGSEDGALAAELAQHTFADSLNSLPWQTTAEDLQVKLDAVFAQASARIMQKAEEFSQGGYTSESESLGTTASVTVVYMDEFTQTLKLLVAHLGDSRVYRVKPTGEVEHLTLDHGYFEKNIADIRPLFADLVTFVLEDDLSSMERDQLDALAIQRFFSSSEFDPLTLTPEQRQVFKRRNRLTKFLGRADVSPTYAVVDIQPGDTFLNLTDGITDVVSDTTFSEVVGSASSTPFRLSKAILAAAKAGDVGPRKKPDPDDKTVIVIKIPDQFLPQSRSKASSISIPPLAAK